MKTRFIYEILRTAGLYLLVFQRDTCVIKHPIKIQKFSGYHRPIMHLSDLNVKIAHMYHALSVFYRV